MLEYIEKFNNLPAEVKQKISSGETMARIEELEKKYGVALASFVMRVMVGDLYYKNITANLIIEFNLAPEKAIELEKELRENIFAGVMDYLSGGKISSVAVVPAIVEEKKPLPAAPLLKVPAAPVNLSIKNFLQEDEKDIAAMGEITERLNPPTGEKTETMLDEVIAEANIGFSSEYLIKRFKDILSTYLRGVRTKALVRENLLKDIVNGGVKLPERDADRVLDIAQKKLAVQENQSADQGKVSARATADGTNFIFKEEEIRQSLEERKSTMKNKPAGSGSMVARDVEYDLAALSKKPKAVDNKSPENLVKQDFASPQKTEKSDIGGAVSMTGVPLPEIPVKNIPPIAPKSEPILQKNDEVRRTAAVAGNKRRIEDVKSSPRIMSPIDELAYMDLVNFRRLDQSPAKRIAKIEEKINLLEKEGIDKKIAGIRAWRNNPVSRTYLSMGQESIVGGKNIDAIIKERQDQGLNYLDKEEFEAVMDLNDSLRF
jgi:hypothetical protein